MALTDNIVSFASRDAMAERVADVIEMQLARGLAERGCAELAVSGGSTPADLYRTLSRREVNWSNVTATLVDERWAAPGEPGSNESFVRDTLLKNNAAAASLVGLWSDVECASKRASAAEERLSRRAAPYDAVILGMGVDGHTASWFPNARGLDVALGEAGPLCAVIQADPSDVVGEHRRRLTQTLAALLDARFICLVIAGADKRSVFEVACGHGPVETMPVRAILRARRNIWVCWSP